MDTRREFLKKAGMLAGGAGLWSMLPPSLKKAMAINPDIGSTFYDAEHIVFLMQENRSFDHCFGSLQGVRGFNDPRAITLPNRNKVWLQTNQKGETYLPFRLNIKDTRATWMGSLPHSWENQVDARNEGKYDKWLIAKRPGNPEYKDMPLTMGYYNREDIPFYYAFADAFTVCDQHFCSSLTGTTSNRMFFWTGTIKDGPGSPAWVRNSDIGYTREVSWKTFPERLEEKGISWKVYQNELSIRTELRGEEEGLLANFTNNNLEWFEQYNVRFSPGHYDYLVKTRDRLQGEISKLEKNTSEEAVENKNKITAELAEIQKQLEKWSPKKFAQLDERAKALHLKGLATNHNDPDYHRTEEIGYKDEEGVERKLKVPKGDIFHEFRKDVKSGNLPTVTWLVAPEYFSDHPTAPWYGAWYVSEALDILTEDPEVWKKTIFILNYDENDGYFDHIPPYVAPNPKDISTGKTSEQIDSADEFVTIEEELGKPGMNPKYARESAVGLGYRVPLIIASPWSRGGWVNSEICDITSTLMFLEKFLNKKFNINIKEDNINSWRRAICGDLTSAFRPYNGEKIHFPKKVERNVFMQGIHSAKFKGLPEGYKSLSDEEIRQINSSSDSTLLMPRQELGTRDSNALKYELIVEESIAPDKDYFALCFKAGTSIFGMDSLGAAFNVYAPNRFRQKNKEGEHGLSPVKTWSFATEAGGEVSYRWKLVDFEGDQYHLRVYSANGFYREYKGNKDHSLTVNASYDVSNDKKKTYLVLDLINNHPSDRVECEVVSSIYGNQTLSETVAPSSAATVKIDVGNVHNWYEIDVYIKGDRNFFRKFAGRVEDGRHSRTDPLMGRDL